ncbi:hypothetical protein B0H11DRAFT_2282469 [Mycena galericulata]|nr:hypothetical protein B0H11DRAFT_2282469 [Mycena galericulata]
MSNSITPPPSAEHILCFESQCGRQGCTHVYQGRDPEKGLAGMSAQVNAHGAHCVGKNFRATAAYQTDWNRVKMRPEFRLEETDDWDTTLVSDVDWSISEDCHQKDSESIIATRRHELYRLYEADEDSMKGFRDGDFNLTYPESNHSRSTPSTYETDDEDDSMGEPPAPQPKRKPKKTARTEAQRKSDLENDPWILSYDVNEVECGGCGKSIKLDARSRYYPGLWLKHRLRCATIKNGGTPPAKLPDASQQGAVATSSSSCTQMADEAPMHDRLASLRAMLRAPTFDGKRGV